MDIPTMADLNRVEQKVDKLIAMLANAMDYTSARKVVTVTDICNMEGVSKTQILGKELYLLPNFGESEFPVGTTRWNLDTYLNWRAIPASTRYQMMVKHFENVRKAEMKNKKGDSAEL